jgi:hypothetical protein
MCIPVDFCYCRKISVHPLHQGDCCVFYRNQPGVLHVILLFFSPALNRND